VLDKANVLASRLMASWMAARVTKVSRVPARFSKSLARRRSRLNQEKLSSTTQRRGRTTKPSVCIRLDFNLTVLVGFPRQEPAAVDGNVGGAYRCELSFDGLTGRGSSASHSSEPRDHRGATFQAQIVLPRTHETGSFAFRRGGSLPRHKRRSPLRPP
jgi:hypothetical protein